MSLPEGGLPLGFVPSGPPVSPYSRGGDTAYTAAGVPLPPSTIGSHHHRLPSNGKYTGSTATVPMPGGYNDVFASGSSDHPAVIPPRSAKYADSEDESVSSSISSSLTTPPARKINMVKASGDPYYRTPGSVRSTASRLTGAGVPLPPSTVAGTPRTSHSHTPDIRHLHAGVTPANLHRTMSFSTERNASVRG
ncbi:hypothetical protein SERLA73DRAFT_179663 [Serpula lacrymans var. lacrymans S7.3]|uniref:Uncharacterized protein n=2 Tax=Serpula lacrymans var. lacrymans TaxID=341189 RepID=F8PVZ0_SERL3|nr:uncharacterized protein SERLADRAFT_464869 [Serpula lacrymans var. lacrymans S7.9]EGN99586.1 hypothetical protein SERLA73DRAFT_179663 [Serpula lacrymans var. lacrymans S7.3]EGO25155.1 hypothetical protein SERLADRAFT_464869 [Serpula lacrymans var. lacrymans S7.9]